jgi:hypothetical protein
MDDNLSKVINRNGQTLYQELIDNKDDNELQAALNNKLLLAQKCADKAVHNENQDSIWWSRIADFLYADIKKSLPVENRESIKLSRLWVKANAIKRFGAKEDDSLLNPDLIINDTKQLASISKKNIGKDFKQLTIEEIKILRTLKNRLSVLKYISDGDQYFPDAHVLELIQLRNSLP